jgi:hypothetical protein
MVSQAPASPARGNPNHPPSEEASLSAHIYMFNGIYLTTRTKIYDTLTKHDKEKVTNSNPPDPSLATVSPLSRPIHIEKPTFDSIFHPPKSTIRKSTFNPSSRATQNYNIVEYLAQESCVMSSLEFLKHCPSQCRTLLASIGEIDPESSNNITFNLDNFKS